MESFYTIIYCQIRAVADEKVSIGLLLRNGPTVVFKYSHDKLKVIKELLPLPAYRLLKANLRNMETFFLNYKDGNPYNLSTNTLFGTMIKETIAVPRYVNSSYIDYLNTYSSNLLTFSKAFPLSANIINDDLYNILYQKFI